MGGYVEVGLKNEGNNAEYQIRYFFAGSGIAGGGAGTFAASAPTDWFWFPSSNSLTCHCAPRFVLLCASPGKALPAGSFGFT